MRWLAPARRLSTTVATLPPGTPHPGVPPGPLQQEKTSIFRWLDQSMPRIIPSLLFATASLAVFHLSTMMTDLKHQDIEGERRLALAERQVDRAALKEVIEKWSNEHGSEMPSQQLVEKKELQCESAEASRVQSELLRFSHELKRQRSSSEAMLVEQSRTSAELLRLVNEQKCLNSEMQRQHATNTSTLEELGKTEKQLIAIVNEQERLTLRVNKVQEEMGKGDCTVYQALFKDMAKIESEIADLKVTPIKPSHMDWTLPKL